MTRILQDTKPNVAILATGGTIAGVGKKGQDIGYQSGALAAEDLIAGIPQIRGIANIQVAQICNINSDDIDYPTWIKLANAIEAFASKKNVDGIVITHGTDTMEETALFLSLTLKTKKPVVLTGSMRPATAKNPDGPRNLCQAVRVAAGNCNRSGKKSAGVKGGNNVCVAFAGKVFDGLALQKVHANKLNPFSSAFALGPKSTIPKFSLKGVQKLPVVSVLYFNADASVQLLNYAAKQSQGLVIAGAGAGEFSQSWAKALAKVSIPVVVCTRTNQGCVLPGHRLVPSTIAGYNLSPAKAAVLLRLALTKTADTKKLEIIFSKFKEEP